MMNRGDLDGAMRVLNEQMRLISLAMGKPIPAIDALADFPDLRAAVDGMQMTEDVAMQLARGRAQDSGRQAQDRQQQEQRQQQDQQRQAQETQQKAWDAGLKAVDEFTNKMKSTDLDFAAIEAKLLPRIPALINGVPPAQWAAKVQTLYEMIKDAAGSGRAAPIPTNTLRPTGSASPSQAPKNMHEAMWGTAG
jgi:hypothetical protein